MCGIAGAFSFNPAAQQRTNRAVVSRLTDLLRHRGPDGEGLWLSDDARVVLGHRRLAIIDIGPAGAQPMVDATGRWTITFNGQIYNYQKLRSELEDLGCVFRTNSDTEVLINVVAQWGEPGLLKLRGMFAFALWDALQEELWLVRDPYGIKPLYVSEAEGTIWFSSQARSLADCAPVDTRREAAAITGFYLWGHVPEPFSWWAGIKMLPAGHVQRIRAGQALAASRSFYCIQDLYIKHPADPIKPGELRQLMLDSVRHHLVADVPVGVFLSAGVDSNVIAALAAELGTQLRTVTLAFDEYAGTPNDEAPIAELAAKKLRSDHLTVRVRRAEFEELLHDFLRSMDQPSIDGLNAYLVSRAAASQGLKVALSGLGGDELFGGYASFHQIPTLLDWSRRIPLRNILGRHLQKIVRTIAPVSLSPKVAGLFAYSGDIASAYLLRRALHLEDELEMLLDESWLTEGLSKLSTIPTLTKFLAPLRAGHATVHSQIAALESCWYMRNQLLRDTDWASMAHGLEIRVPFVDVRLLERLALAIASKSPPTKEDLAACAVPPLNGISARPKTGFQTPVRDWIAEKDGTQVPGLRGWAADVHRHFRKNSQSAGSDLRAVAAA